VKMMKAGGYPDDSVTRLGREVHLPHQHNYQRRRQWKGTPNKSRGGEGGKHPSGKYMHQPKREKMTFGMTKARYIHSLLRREDYTSPRKEG
jgi:hypothetical protein